MIETKNHSRESLTTVVYSHTEFLDILEIQLDYIQNLNNKVLLINESDLDISKITNKFDRVIKYNDSLPYTGRIRCLSELEEEVILFFHDIDILLSVDLTILTRLKEIMLLRDIDRIDLQYNDDFNNKLNEEIRIDDDKGGFSLLHQTNGYVYNVNPSLWKLTALIDVMSAFPDASYRNIELVAQNYCASNFKFFKLNSTSHLNCGYFRCLYFFVFLHITHGGKLLSLDSHRLDSNIRNTYRSIFDRYDLGNSVRNFN